jgi:hypothetical protein
VTVVEELAVLRSAWARDRARTVASLEASRVICPVCSQRVDTKNWWAQMVPKATTIVVHLSGGVYCPGSRTDALTDAEVLTAARLRRLNAGE